MIRDPWSVAGLATVALVALLCLLAPWIAPDPLELRPWLGGLPPLARSPDVPADLELSPGAAAPLGARAQVTITGAEVRRAAYRCALRRGVLEIRAPDARLVEHLDVPAGATVAGRDGVARPALPGRIVAGAPAPAWLVDASAPVRYLTLAQPTAQHVWQVTVAEGRITGGDAPARLRGDQVQAIVVDGVPRTRLHLCGTDLQGRDLWARTLHGGRISLLVGLVATLVSLVIGVVYGAIAGYRGGRTDALMMGGVDVLSAMPFLFLVVLLMTLVGNNLFVLFAALGAVQWLTTARIVRAQVLSLAAGEFIAAARTAGLPAHRIVLRHLIPNCLGPIIVFGTLTVPAVILEESFLSFIGLGVLHDGQPLDSWGALVAQGMAALGAQGERAWLLLVPAMMMTLTLLGLNLAGDGLRDALDPRRVRGR